MYNYQKHLIKAGTEVKEALKLLDELAPDSILFILNEEDKLIGSLTDGDVRRGVMKGLTLKSNISDFIESNPKCLTKGEYTIEDVIHFREEDLRIIPVINKDGTIINIVNFRHHKSYLPIDTVIMAGGRGERLKPLTDTTPKPLLEVGGKPIIEHNIDRLISFGADDFWLSVRYLGHQIESYFGSGENKNSNIQYVWEDEPLGTIGAVSKIENFQHDYVLVTNSDILTNLDYEDFYKFFMSTGSDLSVLTIPYNVEIPYAVLDTNDNDEIISFKEKPTFTYYSNGGIYLMKREVLDLVPKDAFHNATDLMEMLIAKGKKVTSFPLRGYWLDVGKHEDFRKANEDIHHIQFK